MKKAQEKYTSLNYLRQHTKSDPDLMIDMINIYLEQTPALIGAMKSGLAQSDWQMLRAAAHKLVPSFRIMGIQGGYEIKAKRIEELAARQESIDIIGPLVADLEKICGIIYGELEQEVIGLKKLGR
jgi:HPt (histidine-containing phosphotransfer) domain-containing protein